MSSKNPRSAPSLLALALALASLALPASPVRAAWAVGNRLPELAASGLTGRIPATTNAVVLVDFWASWCAPCKRSFPELDKLEKEYGPRGFRIVAVCVDDKQSAMDTFLQARPVSFTTAWDAPRKGRLVEQAAIETMPTSFLVDRSGVIRHRHLGFNEKTSVAEYRREIEALLQEGSPSHEK